MSHLLGPPVKCGYCGWLIQGCQNIIRHKCLEHYDEYQHYLKVDDNFVVTLIPRADATPDQATVENSDENSEFDECLIKAVETRPVLYNVKIPLKERTKLKKDALWLEVSNSLGDTDVDNVKKRWQYLRDCFMKEKNKQQTYTPSGSAAVPLKKPAFRHYGLMRFLCDSLPSIQTVSNIQPPQSPSGSGSSTFSPNPSISCSPGLSSAASTYVPIDPICIGRNSLPSPSPPPRTPTPGAKKRKTDDSNSDIRSVIMTALQQPVPPVPQPDAVDGMLARLGEGLRRLPYRERSALEIKFLSLLMEAEENLNSLE